MEIGTKVVCINDVFEPWVSNLYKELPKAGKTYVIRDVRLGVAFEGKKKVGAVSLLLVGLVNPHAEGRAQLERGFNADRFRPLDEIQAESKAIQENQPDSGLMTPTEFEKIAGDN